MQIAGLGLVLIFATVGASCAQEAVHIHGPPAAAAAIIAADRAFAARAIKVGSPRAFGEVMDVQDGLFFLPGADPIRGAAAIQAIEQKEVGAGKLAWAPSEVFAASAGDMGLTWGHWSFTPPSAPSPVVTGRYQTVWRKDGSGRWKGLTDIGQPNPSPPGAAPH